MPFYAIFHAARRPAGATRSLLVALLIAALLCSHWQGLVHRISHASRMLGTLESAQMTGGSELRSGVPSGVPSGLPSGVPSGASASTDQPLDQGAGHSCLAFDAATVGAALCGTPFTAMLSPERPVLQAWIAFISYLAPLTPHFSSRAPPLP